MKFNLQAKGPTAQKEGLWVFLCVFRSKLWQEEPRAGRAGLCSQEAPEKLLWGLELCPQQSRVDARLAPGVTLSSADVNCGMTPSGGPYRQSTDYKTTAPLTAGDLEAGWG